MWRGSAVARSYGDAKSSVGSAKWASAAARMGCEVMIDGWEDRCDGDSMHRDEGATRDAGRASAICRVGFGEVGG